MITILLDLLYIYYSRYSFGCFVICLLRRRSTRSNDCLSSYVIALPASTPNPDIDSVDNGGPPMPAPTLSGAVNTAVAIMAVPTTVVVRSLSYYHREGRSLPFEGFYRKYWHEMCDLGDDNWSGT